jgi:hypothetical protein
VRLPHVGDGGRGFSFPHPGPSRLSINRLLGNNPFFVPPGRVLLFWPGVAFAPSVSVLFARCVGACDRVVGRLSSRFRHHQLAGAFLLCWSWWAGRQLFSLMLVISLVLELYGTWIGNRAWQTDVPYLDLTSNNPAFAAAAVHCVLDVLVGMRLRALGAARPNRQLAWRCVQGRKAHGRTLPCRAYGRPVLQDCYATSDLCLVSSPGATRSHGSGNGRAPSLWLTIRRAEYSATGPPPCSAGREFFAAFATNPWTQGNA